MRIHDMSGTHLEDGVLQGVLDGEVSDGREHLAACETCAARLQAMRGRGERVRALLVRTDWPVPDTRLVGVPFPARRRLSPAWPRAARPLRIAAAVAGLLALGALATPARAWIAAWLERGWTAVAGDTERPADPDAPAGAGAQRAPRRTVQYSPVGSELAIVVEHPQRAGELILERAEGSAVRVEVLGEGEANVLVLPEGVRIGNHPERTGAYRVSVPAAVEVIRVRAGDGRVLELRRDDVPATGYSVPLARVP